jgi:hypothetical protein
MGVGDGEAAAIRTMAPDSVMIFAWAGIKKAAARATASHRANAFQKGIMISESGGHCIRIEPFLQTAFFRPSSWIIGGLRLAKKVGFIYYFPMSGGLKKSALIGLAGWILVIGAAHAQKLKSGEQAFFLKNGDMMIGSIVEINAEKASLMLSDGASIPIRDLWMINFVNEQWNFPNERSLIETNEHYVFLKTGDVTSGRVTAFTADKREFEFEAGDKFPIVSIRRIYFAKSLPRNLR